MQMLLDEAEVKRGYAEVSLPTASKLFDVLSPNGPLGDKKELYFRGHGDSEWKLIPSALRSQGLTKAYFEGMGSDDRVFFEMMLFKNFLISCDSVGIRLPNDSVSLRKKLEGLASRSLSMPEKWPVDEWHELMAFAQHHEVPTRLLDWSKQPMVGAYFAASGALEELEKERYKLNSKKKLAIWIMDKGNFELLRDRLNAELVYVPGSISPHVSAQSGLFSIQYYDTRRGQDLNIKSLEDACSGIPKKELPFVKITLPIWECVNLMKLCEKSGFHHASVYRSADAAGKAVKDYMRLNIASDKMNL